ncbi:MAG: DUF721 domain-containing protein [Alistipes sp.]|nr:DUF721 domain-containing protein [Alistipes sp.]
MRRSNPVLVGDILKEFFERPYVAAKIAEGKLPDFWREIVGEHIANLTTYLKLENHILYVGVMSSVARHELFYRREELMQRMNERAGIRLINAIIVR